MSKIKASSNKLIAYYRVSTQKQGHSGLGLEAQRQAVTEHVRASGTKIVAEFTEIESGGRADRPELGKALAACRLYGATLVVAKLDRLSRNVAFLSNLMEAGVEFVACDFPKANRLTLHVLVAVAEHERDAISERTKAALAAWKVRNPRKKLGTPRNLTRRARLRGSRIGNEVKSLKSKERAKDVMPAIREALANGAGSLREVAAALNDKQIPAPQGGEWHPNTVARTMRAAGT